MSPARLTVDPDFTVGEVDPRLFGNFVEHLGRCVYTGIHEPGHPSADADGFRGDVEDLVRELGVTLVRYPGGNFVSGYRWEDGVGPVGDRPARLDGAWKTTEPNTVGTDEFCAWARRMGVEPLMAVNLGTRGVEAAAALVEYCNHPGGSSWSDLRIANGHPEPHAVKYWCLGNEMDGPWQIGHKTAHEYGRLAAEAGKAMRLVDPTIELVACGSSGRLMPTFGEWESTVLDHAFDVVDHISLHSYTTPGPDADVASFLASGVEFDEFIDGVVATADAVAAKRHSDKRIGLSFDEWNVWHRYDGDEDGGWSRAPRLLEVVYDAQDAVVVGGMLISLLRHADRVKIGCLAQLVNVIAPIMTDPGGAAWRQTIFHPIAATSRHGRGTVLDTRVSSDTVPTAKYGEVTAVDAVAVRGADDAVTVFAVNRGQADAHTLSVDLGRFPQLRTATVTLLATEDRAATNTADAPGAVVPRELDAQPLTEGRFELELPPVSWAMVRLTA